MHRSIAATVLSLSLLLAVSMTALSQFTLTLEQEIVNAVATYYLANPPSRTMASAWIAGPPLPLRASQDCEECPVLAWVIELGPIGFMVTSWDPRVEPLIAFSTESEFPWEEDAENALRSVLIEDMMTRTEAHDAGLARGADANTDKWRSIVLSTTTLDPYDLVGIDYGVTTYASCLLSPGPISTYEGPQPLILPIDQWDQELLYNEYCPCSLGCHDVCSNTSQRYKPGCVARAMAQVLYFHRFLDIQRMDSIVGQYDSNCPTGSTSSGDCCTLGKQDLGLGNPTYWTVSTAASRLCFSAAASLSAEFGMYATGATFSDAAQVLETIWQFSPTTLFGPNTVGPACFDHLEADVLCRRLSLLELAGYSAYHAVVCDGYKREHAAENGTLLQLTNFYHLQMGRSCGGTTAWYNLTNPKNYPQGYCATNQVILDIAPPGTPACVGTCSVDLRVDRENGRYEQSDHAIITASVGRPAATVLYDFNPAIYSDFSFLSPFTFWTGDTIGTGSEQLSLIPFRIQGNGIQTLVLVADMGSCIAIDSCRYAVGVDKALLNKATIGIAERSGTRSIRYHISCDCNVIQAWVFLINPHEGPISLPCAQTTSGTISASQLPTTIPGECLVVLIANTTLGVLAATCRY
jgi:peptidase C10-like protein